MLGVLSFAQNPGLEKTSRSDFFWRDFSLTRKVSSLTKLQTCWHSAGGSSTLTRSFKHLPDLHSPAQSLTLDHLLTHSLSAYGSVCSQNNSSSFSKKSNSTSIFLKPNYFPKIPSFQHFLENPENLKPTPNQ